MRIEIQVLFVTLLFVFSFLATRSILWGVKELYLSKNERKKRKKEHTFKEWLLYTRYREEIPRILLWLYFTVLIIHPLLLMCVWIAFFVEPLQGFTSILSIVLIAFDVFWSTIIILLSWKPGDRWLHYERLTHKKVRKKKRR